MVIIDANIAMIDDRELLENIEDVPVGFGVLAGLFSKYASPAAKIAQLCTKGYLIRLKKGLYVVSPRISRTPLPAMLAANHLHGPSYVSFHTALEYHGLIPEAVHVFMSATPGRAKKYATPIGEYEYRSVPAPYYPIGIDVGKDAEGRSFLIASPEKAICDLLLLENALRIRSVGAMWSYLTDFMRMDEDALGKLDADLIGECCDAGKKKEMLGFLQKAVGNAK